MEELLKEILAELKKLNSGIIMSADDMLALLERNKQITDDRTRSVYKESFEMYKAQKAEEKPEAKEYTLREVVEKISGYIETRNSDACVELGDVIIIKHNIRAVKKIELLNGNTARAIVELNDGSGIFATINLRSLMDQKL